MSRVRKVVLREYIEKDGKDGGYWQYWLGSVPPDGMPYYVTDAEWGHENGCPDPVRYIYAWELARAKGRGRINRHDVGAEERG